MFFYEGQSCPVCGKAFAETDDIVACPECGAPHHRDCWKQEGRCHFADKHGTAEQWKRPEAEEKTAEESRDSDWTPPTEPKSEDARRCPHCGKENPTYAEFCSRCGRSLVENDWAPPPPSGTAYTPFHAQSAGHTGSMPREELLDEDVTAGEAALAVGTNQQYYLPRFARMYKENRPVSWNWVACFFPAPWLFYRRAYGAGMLVLLVQVIGAVLGQLVMLPFSQQYAAIMSQLMEGAITAQQFAMQYNTLLENFTTPMAVYAFDLLSVLITVGMGLFGNYIYRCSVMRRCRKLKADFPEDYEARLPIEGGVSAGLFALALVITEFLPNIIAVWFI
ncbi:MAG: DUF2628 domain-containing protein [Clostridia bacterium]|nr:DUF2628 domain-containing protein [Clostridia bacterium]